MKQAIENEATYFVPTASVVRRIWSTSDTVLFIFAGAAAEFALNKAVDWLYFTGKLPADPLGRLFSTVTYARQIVFATTDEAHKTIDTIRQIHTAVENNRAAIIPDGAYRDVLYMLVHYSIASYELLEKKLSETEKEEVYEVFYRLGTRMGLSDLPTSYTDWLTDRSTHLAENLTKSKYTADLFKQYKKHLGLGRYLLLLETQKLLVPIPVKTMLHFNAFSILSPVLPVYKLVKKGSLARRIKALILPMAYQKQINAIDVIPI